MNLYNDIEPYVCDWAENLIEQRGAEDERHLWPHFFNLVQECEPPVIFGEQVPDAIRLGWLDGIFADLEGIGYACGAVVLPAACVGAPHIRHRIYWVAYANQSDRISQFESCQVSQPPRCRDLDGLADPGRMLRSRPGQSNWLDAPERMQSGIDADESGVVCRLGNADISGSFSRNESTQTARYRDAVVTAGIGANGLGDTELHGLRGCGRTNANLPEQSGDRSLSAWSEYRIVHCRDGKARRIGSTTPALVAGLPRSLGRGSARSDRIRLVAAKANRVGRIRGYGNSIVPQVAAEFVRLCMERGAA